MHTPATRHVLGVSGLHTSRSGKPILMDVSLSAREGEVLGLIGPNGSGKTTLFESIAGLLPAIGGIELLDERTKPDSRKHRIFYVPDGIRPWPGQTVSWVLDLQRSIFRDTRMHIDDLRAVLPQLGFDYTTPGAAGSWQELCPACKRKTLSITQMRIKEEARG